MKKEYLIAVGVILVLIVGFVGYSNKHAIKLLLMGATPTPTEEAMMNEGASPSSSPDAMMNGELLTWKSDSKKGSYAVSNTGMTLYTYDKDTKGVSNCSGGCLQAWPAYLEKGDAMAKLPENVTLIKRADGTMQYAYKGKALYYYATDQKPGDITGDGVGGVWHIVKE